MAIPTTALEHHFAELGQCRLHYVSRGEGKPILFLHGFPQFWFLWRRQLADLGDDHAVFAPDMRGYNLSCKSEDPEAYRMRHLLADVKELIEQLDIAPLTLVGHDWGGIVSWAFALKYPEMLERLVIIDAPPPFTWNRDLRESPKQPLLPGSGTAPPWKTLSAWRACPARSSKIDERGGIICGHTDKSAPCPLYPQ